MTDKKETYVVFDRHDTGVVLYEAPTFEKAELYRGELPASFTYGVLSKSTYKELKE